MCGTPASQTATSRLAAASQPMSMPAAETHPDPRIHDILERLEKRGRTIHDLSAKLRWEIFDEIIEDKQAKIGQLLFKREEPHPKFFVRFDKTIIEDQVIRKAEEHLFDGRWYIEKREATKSVIKRQIVREGEKFDPFRIGQGPFPLPFGQKEADIIDRFDVTLIAPQKGDPAASEHLKLLPKGGELAAKYRELHFYISQKIDLPVKIVAKQKDDKVLTVWFEEVKVNSGIAGGRFAVQIPSNDPTWSYTVETLPPENPKEP